MKRYYITGERDGWQLLNGYVFAASEKAAKAKFRRKYKRAQFLKASEVQNLEQHAGMTL